LNEPPFRVEASRTALSNPFLVVREDALVGDGARAVHYVVELPRAAVVVPILDDGRILLIRQYRHCVGRSLIELPAGRVGPDETPAQGAIRELREETGYAAREWSALAEFFPLAGLSDHHAFLFEARGLAAGPTNFDPFEHVEPLPTSPKDAAKMLRSGEIVDGFCQLGLLHWFTQRGGATIP
jgi:ADP-ribose pyrophosphatase